MFFIADGVLEQSWALFPLNNSNDLSRCLSGNPESEKHDAHTLLNLCFHQAFTGGMSTCQAKAQETRLHPENVVTVEP